MRLAAPVFLAAILTTAGCIGGPAGTRSHDEATALGQLDAAIAASHGAPLLLVFTVQLAEAATAQDLPAWLAPFAAADPNPADGHASAWGYVFGQADGHTHGASDGMLVIVRDGRADVVAIPTDFPVAGSAAIDTGGLADSPAVFAAATANAEWTSIASTGFTFAYLTGTFPATWILQAGAFDTDAHASVGVDPTSGTLVRAGTRDPWAFVPTEAGTFSGAAPDGQVTDNTFLVSHAGHKQIEFVIRQAGGVAIEFEAIDPAGQAHAFHWDGSGGTGQRWFDVASTTSGEWTVRAWPAGDGADYEVSWCALGWSRCP